MDHATDVRLKIAIALIGNHVTEMSFDQATKTIGDGSTGTAELENAILRVSHVVLHGELLSATPK